MRMSKSWSVEFPPRETAWMLGYFAVYMAYHSTIAGESDKWHWFGLVAMPLALLFALRRLAQPTTSFADILRSVGLRRENLKTGLGWAIGLGLGISLLQSLGRVEELWEMVKTGKAFYMFPLVLALLFFTAGFTEEIFFRGILQTRLEKFLGPIGAILTVSVLFSIYHIPYTYLNPNWPSAGNWGAAIQAAFVNGTMGGVVLGTLYYKTKHNLAATIVLHSLINSIPAMTLIKINFGN
jgi:membrane protease YdiL (CAAX protease family)